MELQVNGPGIVIRAVRNRSCGAVAGAGKWCASVWVGIWQAGSGAGVRPRRGTPNMGTGVTCGFRVGSWRSKPFISC